MLVLTSSNKRRIKLESAVIEKAFVQLDTTPRTQQAGSSQASQDFHDVIHSDSKTHVKLTAINQFKANNQQRALVAELNTDLRNIFTDLRGNLAVYQITTPNQ